PLQQSREETKFKRIRLGFGNITEHRWFKDINACVDRVAGDFIWTGLLNESLNPAIGCGFNQTVGGRILHRGQDDCCDGALRFMESNDGSQIDGRQHIAIKTTDVESMCSSAF